MKLKHLVANKPKLSLKDREKLRKIEDSLQEIRLRGSVVYDLRRVISLLLNKRRNGQT